MLPVFAFSALAMASACSDAPADPVGSASSAMHGARDGGAKDAAARASDPRERMREERPAHDASDRARGRFSPSTARARNASAQATGDRLGVLVRGEGYDESWRGTIEEIPDAVGARKLRPQDPGRPTDARVLDVKIALEGATPLKLGQRVELEISAKGRGPAQPKEKIGRRRVGLYGRGIQPAGMTLRGDLWTCAIEPCSRSWRRSGP